MNLNALLLVLAVFGGISLTFQGMQLAFTLFPGLLSVRSWIWGSMSDLVKVGYFKKAAIATGVEQVVNQTVFQLQQQLPNGWIRRAKIKWVRNTQMAEYGEGKLVLRVRPQKDRDANFINAVYAYFSGALFPNTKDLLSTEVVSAIAMAVTRVSLERSHGYLIEEFDSSLLSELKQDNKEVFEYFADCLRLNDYGFLMGPFVREIDHAAANARFSGGRDEIGSRIRLILDHMLRFQAVNLNIPDDEWYYQGPYTSYGFSLVSNLDAHSN